MATAELVSLQPLGLLTWHSAAQVIGSHHWGRVSLWSMALRRGIARRLLVEGLSQACVRGCAWGKIALPPNPMVGRYGLSLVGKPSVALSAFLSLSLSSWVAGWLSLMIYQAYYLEKDRWVPNDDTPLVWTQTLDGSVKWVGGCGGPPGWTRSRESTGGRGCL